MVLESFRARDLDPCVYVDRQSADVFVSDHPSTHPEHLTGLGRDAKIAALEEIVLTRPVVGFGLVGCPTEQLQHVVNDLAGRAEAHLDRAVDYSGGSLTVAPLGLSKWTGVLAFCDLAGIDQQRVLAIGDGPNDVDLLANAGMSVSLEGSHLRALEVAQHVVRPVGVGGWADLLELL